MAYAAIENEINNTDTSMEVAADYERSTKPKNKSQSILESYGYRVGRVLGTGSYATVKVNRI